MIHIGKLLIPRGILIIGVVVLIIILLPIFVMFNDYFYGLLILLFICLTLSQSWNLMGGYTGQFNLGSAAYFGSGTLSFCLIYAAGVPYYLALLTSGVVAVILALIIGIPTLRLKGIYFGMGTLALAEALNIIVRINAPKQVYAPPNYFTDSTMIKSYYMGLVITIITFTVSYFLVKSKLGLGLQAIRDDEDAAMATGINPARLKLIVFIISSFLIGLVGGFYSFYRGNIIPTYQFSTDWTMEPVVAAFVGGLGTLTGPIWGSIVFVFIQELLTRTLGEAHFIVMGIIFILVILFLPGGLVELRMIPRRLRSRFQYSKIRRSVPDKY